MFGTPFCSSLLLNQVEPPSPRREAASEEMTPAEIEVSSSVVACFRLLHANVLYQLIALVFFSKADFVRLLNPIDRLNYVSSLILLFSLTQLVYILLKR